MRLLKGLLLVYMLFILSGCATISKTTVKPGVRTSAVTAAPGEVFLDYSDRGFFNGERTIYTVRSVGEEDFTLESSTYKKGVNYSTKLALGEWHRDIGFQKEYLYPVTSGRVVIDDIEFIILSVTDGAVSYRRVK